jgi:hypothetical protein
MDLKGIIAISGKPGLYKVAAQGRNNIIVHSLENDKKFPAFASDKISALDDISFYTYDKDMPLAEVFTLLAEKEDFKPSINHKEEAKKLREYLVTFLPTYDAERVYDTDVKKLFQWYNILVEKGFISRAKSEEAAAAAAEATAEEPKPKAKKAAKEPASEGADTKPKAKKAPAKKPAADAPKKETAKATADKKKSAKKS